MAEDLRSTIEILLAEDGVEMPDTEGSEKHINCINEAHFRDDHESLRIDTLGSTYHCYGCGFRGNAYTYLTDYRDMSGTDACKKLRELGWSDERIEAVRDEQPFIKAHSSGLPEAHEEIPKSIVGQRMLVAEHAYHNDDGVLVFIVARYSKTTGEEARRVTFTPNREGGYWMATPHTTNIPEFDRSPFPLYRVNEMREKYESGARKILLLEDEFAVDLFYNAGRNHKMKMAATCIHTRDGDLTQNDLSPLYGEPLLIVANTKEKSRKMALAVGQRLHIHGAAIKYVLPEGEDGYGVADALVEGGWKTAQEWINKVGITHPGEKKGDDPQFPSMRDTKHFQILGSSGTYLIALDKDTNEVMTIPKPQVGSDGWLLTLAPNTWWRSVLDEKGLEGRGTRRAVHSAILEAARKEGIFNLNANTRGRGATKLDGIGIIYNVGNKMLVQGKSGLLDAERKIEDFKELGSFVPGPAIHLLDDDNVEHYAKEFVSAVMSYRWNRKEDGKAFLGWLVTSLVGGALRQKPMVWMQAPASSGKSWLFEHVIYALMGEFLHEIANVTEAGLASRVQHDAIPVYLDEFEPKEGQSGRQQFNSVLSLLRIASSGRGQRVRADTRRPGGTSEVRPRFSAIIASVNKPNLSVADASRFYMIQLSRRMVADWDRVQKEIVAATTTQKMLALRTHIIRNTPNIVHRIEQRELKIRAKTTREAQILAGLSEGYSFLSGSETVLSMPELMEEETNSEYTILNELLSSLIPVDRAERLSITECLTRAYYGQLQPGFSTWSRTRYDKTLSMYAARYGFRLETHDMEGKEVERPFLLCAINHPPMAQLLSRTEHGNVNLYIYLKNLPGAVLPRNPSGKRKRHYIGGSTKSAVLLPPHALEICGFFPEDPPQQSDITDVDD